MASTIKNIAKSRLMSALMDLDEAGDDMRAILCMTNTTADTDVDADNTGTYTLDEHDSTTRKTCDNQAVATDDTNDRAEWTCDPLVWTTLANGARQIQGILIHEFITNDAASFPLAFIEFASTINPGGSTLTVTPNAEGLVQLT